MFMAMLARHCDHALDLAAEEFLQDPASAPRRLRRPQPDDERQHASGAEQLWSESWYFDAVSADGALGAYVRVGSYPNLGVCWYTACMCGPGRPTWPAWAGPWQRREPAMVSPGRPKGTAGGHGVPLGTATRGAAGLKKNGIPSSSGAVHGHRYNARILARHIARTYFEIDPARPTLKRDDVLDYLLSELSRAPGLFDLGFALRVSI